MKLFDVLSKMNPDSLTSIQFEGFAEPIMFGKVARMKPEPTVDCYTVKAIYPEYYKGSGQTGITVIVENKG